MIQFSCPKCQSVLSATEQQAGIKVACPKCGQRLQVPQPQPNKTVLGHLMPAGAGAGAGQARIGNGQGALAAGAPPAIGPAHMPAHRTSVSATESPHLKVAEWFYTRAGKQ